VLLIAIDGHSAAGKSTRVRTLQAALSQVTIMHTDDFYRPMPEVNRARLDAAGGYQQYYDWQRLEHEVLRPLARVPPSHVGRRRAWVVRRCVVWRHGAVNVMDATGDILGLAVLLVVGQATNNTARCRRCAS